jgi:hypothetical protein
MSKTHHKKPFKESEIKNVLEGMHDALVDNSPDKVRSPDVVPVECTAYSMQCFKNGHHNNFRIMTIKIVDGAVSSIEYSDPYASFEFMDQLETLTRKACGTLNMTWKDKKCLGQ